MPGVLLLAYQIWIPVSFKKYDKYIYLFTLYKLW